MSDIAAMTTEQLLAIALAEWSVAQSEICHERHTHGSLDGPKSECDADLNAAKARAAELGIEPNYRLDEKGY